MNLPYSIEWIFFLLNILNFVLNWILNWIIFRPDSMKNEFSKKIAHHYCHTSSRQLTICTKTMLHPCVDQFFWVSVKPVSVTFCGNTSLWQGQLTQAAQTFGTFPEGIAVNRLLCHQIDNWGNEIDFCFLLHKNKIEILWDISQGFLFSSNWLVFPYSLMLLDNF